MKRIEINPRIHQGQPVIKGTNITVLRILSKVAEGSSLEEIQSQHGLDLEDIEAAVAFADELAANQAFVQASAGFARA